MTGQAPPPTPAARHRRRGRLAIFASAAVLLAGTAAVLALLQPSLLASPAQTGRFADACKPLTVLDAESGQALRGIEDLVTLPDGALLLSAYDRWAAESGETEEDGIVSPSGLYYVAAGWRADDAALRADNLTSELPAFRPHGIDAIVHGDGLLRIFAINRAAGPAQDSVAVDVYDFTGERLQAVARIADRRLCRANDIAALDPQQALVTLDTAACGGLERWRELVLGPPAGAVQRLTLKGEADAGNLDDRAGVAELVPVATGLRFANGIAVDGQEVWVAETRRPALVRLPIASVLAERPRPADSLRRYPLSAGPDNLTVTADGDLLVTQHPSLLRLALHRAAWLRLGRPGTRVDRLNAQETETGDARLEWLDPQGSVLPAGTVAAEAAGGLLVGSVTAAGLAWCREPGDA